MQILCHVYPEFMYFDQISLSNRERILVRKHARLQLDAAGYDGSV